MPVSVFANDENDSWIDSMGVVALFDIMNDLPPDLTAMLSSKVMRKSYKLPAHKDLTKSEKKYPRDEFGAKQYLKAYSEFYLSEKARIEKADSFLVPIDLELGVYNFDLGAYVPKLSIEDAPGDGSFVCGAPRTSGGTSLLACLRVVNLRGGAEIFELLEMSEEQAKTIRRTGVGYALRISPIENEFMDLSVDIRKVGWVQAMLNVRAVELLIYDLKSRDVIYRKAAPDFKGIANTAQQSIQEKTVEPLNSIPQEPTIEIELPK